MGRSQWFWCGVVVRGLQWLTHTLPIGPGREIASPDDRQYTRFCGHQVADICFLGGSNIAKPQRTGGDGSFVGHTQQLQTESLEATHLPVSFFGKYEQFLSKHFVVFAKNN